MKCLYISIVDVFSKEASMNKFKRNPFGEVPSHGIDPGQ